jgi:hypothetical protein
MPFRGLSHKQFAIRVAPEVYATSFLNQNPARAARRSNRVDGRTNATFKLSSPLIVGLLTIGLFARRPAPLCAQVAGARIAGTVTDSTDALIVGAQIRIRDTADGITRELVTNQSGYYSTPNLSSGSYTVSVSAKGFKSEVRSGLTLAVGTDVEVDFKMSIGDASRSVDVPGEAPAVGMNDATLGAVLNAQTVRELPLNGRDWTQLAVLEPGVAQVRTQEVPTNFVGRGNRGLGTQMTVSGGRPQQNNYHLEGVSINDYANGSPGSALGVNLGVDAIQEFSVITGTLRRTTARLPVP